MERRNDFDNIHDGCPVCDATFLGYTDADMVEHFLNEHPHLGVQDTSTLGAKRHETERCGDCGNKYPAAIEFCPWCEHESTDGEYT